MNIQHIRTFVEVANTSNFHRAAERLHVTQSTVSARIRALEERLDRTLFARHGSGVTLTVAGRHFHRHAVAVVRAWEQGRQEVALPAGFRTSFGLGSITGLWGRIMVRWINGMRQAAPDVALRLEVDWSEGLMHQLSDGLLDIGIMYQPRSSPGLLVETLMTEKLVLVSTRRGETVDDDDWTESYVFVNWGYDYRAQHSQAFPDLAPPAVSVGVGELGLKYILENSGSAYLPLGMVRAHLEDGSLHRVRGAPAFARPAYVVYPESPGDPVLMATALDTLKSIVSTPPRRKRRSARSRPSAVT